MPDVNDEPLEGTAELLPVEPPPLFDDNLNVAGTQVAESAIVENPIIKHEERPDRVYADSVPAPAPLTFAPFQANFEAYCDAKPADVATPDQSRFYDPSYRPELRRMVEHVVTTEGPIYFDLLVDRISRAHGFQRAKHTIRDIIRSALGRGRYPHTHDDGQEVIWPAGADTKVLPSFRPGGSRHHTQIPLVELANLARRFLGVEIDDEELVRAMQEALSLGRLTTPTRERFFRAIKIARRFESDDLV